MAIKSNNHSDLVAAFLAKGGKPKVIATGANSGFTQDDWKRAAQGEVPKLTKEVSEQMHEQRVELIQQTAHMRGRTAAIQEIENSHYDKYAY